MAADHINWSGLSAADPVLAAIPEAARRRARLFSADRGAVLFRQGDCPARMFFVLSGEVALVRPAPNGTEAILHRVRYGIVAEASLQHKIYHCEGQVTKPTTVLALELKAIRRALDEPVFRDAWINMISRELRNVRARSERLQLRSAAARIEHYIETEGHNRAVALTGSRKDWAADLGLTHEALYRALSTMVQRKQITMDGAVIALKP